MECPPGRFISTVRLSVSQYMIGDQKYPAIGSFQGFCDDGYGLAKSPRNATNDIYFIVQQDGFSEFVASGAEVIESFMFIGQDADPKKRFELSCPRHLKLSGYQVKSSTVVHSVRIKCSKV